MMDTEHISFTMKSQEAYDKDNLVNSNAFRNVSNMRRRSAFGIVRQYKSQELMDYELDNVEADMDTIHQWERETMLQKRKVSCEGKRES